MTIPMQLEEAKKEVGVDFFHVYSIKCRAKLLSKIGDIRRFPNADKLANFVEIAPVKFSSAGKGGEYLQIHNKHIHGNINNPHTHKPQVNVDPITGTGSSKRLVIETFVDDINYADKAMRNGTLGIRFGKKDKGGL